MYDVVFDVRTASLPLGGLVAPFLVFLLASAVLLVFRPWLVTRGPFRRLPAFPIVYVCGVLLVFGGIVSLMYVGRLRLQKILESGDFMTVEGVVSQYKAGGTPGSTWESFVVDGKKFTYSERNGGAGFRQTRARGGPIADGLRVRIAYVNLGGDEILRVEVARGERAQ